MRGSARSIKLDDEAAASFGSRLAGEVLTPGDGAYDSARAVWNRLIDKHPAVIARCTSADDVAAGVRFAREHDLEIGVRGGGHSIAGASVPEGGLMIDLAPMKSIEVDPERRTARAEPGLKLEEFDRATQAFGLATTMGVASDTGIAGLTLGGGYGWLAGSYGLACDNLLSVEIVTADGELVTANENENADLYWAVRGGGGNFGVVTSFEYQLHAVGPVVGGMAVYPATADALRFFLEFSTECSEAVSTTGLLATAPDGSRVVAIVACHNGPVDEGERALKPLKEFGPPLVDMIQPRSYVDMQLSTDEAWPSGRLYYWKSSLVRSLDDASIETLIEHGNRLPTPLSVIYLQQLHGAASRVAPDATAFPHRFDHYNCGAMLEAEDPADVEKGISWARATWNAMQSYAERSAYVNDLGDEGDERVREAYGANYERLRAIKGKYDPENVFRLNQNVSPRRG